MIVNNHTMKKPHKKLAREPATMMFGPLNYRKALECIASMHEQSAATHYYLVAAKKNRSAHKRMLSTFRYIDLFATPASWQVGEPMPTETPPLRTIAETQHLLGFSRSQVYRLGYDGKLELKKVGAHSTRVTQESIDRFLGEAPRLEQHRQPASRPKRRRPRKSK